MTRLFRALILRSLDRHRLRAALATIAVALGVTAFLSSASVGAAIERTAGAALRGLAGGVELTLEPAGRPLAPADLATVRAVPEVAVAAPIASGWCAVRGGRDARVFVVGVDPFAELELGREGAATEAPDLAPADGARFLAGTAALIGSPLADELGVGSGGALELLGANGWTQLSVAAVVEPTRAGAGGRVVVLSTGGAARLLGRSATFDRIDLGPAADVSEAEVVRAVRAALGPERALGVHVGPPRASDGNSADVLAAVQVGLRIGAVVALLIGMFLIHHTLAVGVVERRREIGILRAVGATRVGVRTLFAGEAAMLGLTGSLLGIALAWVLGRGALQGFAHAVASVYFADEPPEPELSPTLLLLGLLVGVGTSILAATVPAGRAAAEAPSDAIRRGPEADARRRGRRGIVWALVLGAGSVALVLVPGVRGDLAAYGSALLSIVAFLLGVTPLVGLAGRLLAPVLAAVGGLPGRLAADDLVRHPTRAALPAAALAFGLALVVETGGVVHSLSEETVEWMEEQVAGDLFVSSGTKVMGVGNNTPVTPDTFDGITDVPGVAHSVPVRFQLVPFRDTRIFLMGLGMEGYRPMAKLTVLGAPRDQVLRRLMDGRSCIASENFCDLYDVSQGDRVELLGVDGPFELEIVATFRDYSWPRGSLMVDLRVFREGLGDDLLDEVSVQFDDGADPETVTRDIEARYGPGRALVTTPAAELREAARELLDDFFSISYAQVFAALSVAFLGVFNAVWISIVLRRRELGLLRAVGATRRQVVASIVLQAAALGVVGSVLGLVGGIAIQWLVLHRLLPADTGWAYPLRVPWAWAVLCVLLGVVTSALAGLIPARRAAATPIRDAIGYE